MKPLLFLATVKGNTESGKGIIRSILKLVYVHILKGIRVHVLECFLIRSQGAFSHLGKRDCGTKKGCTEGN
jgi:hypothetical protein